MLIECPECHGTVSDMANACPHCGYDMTRPYITEEERRERMIGCYAKMIFGAIMLIVFILIAIFG